MVLSYNFCFVLFAFEVKQHVGVNLVFSDKPDGCVHRRKVLTLKDSYLDLEKLGIQSRRHHDIWILFTSRIIFDLNLFVALVRNGDRDLDVTLDFGVVVSVRVAESKPLVEQQVLIPQVNITHVKFKLTNKLFFLEKPLMD